MNAQPTYQSARRQISRALCLARVLVAEDTWGSGPAGFPLVDQDPTRGRVVVNRLDTVSAMLRGQCGNVIQEFGHAKISGRLEYETPEHIKRMEVTVTSQEGQGVRHYRIQRDSDGGLSYSWRVDGGPEWVVVERNDQLFFQDRELVTSS